MLEILNFYKKQIESSLILKKLNLSEVKFFWLALIAKKILILKSILTILLIH